DFSNGYACYGNEDHKIDNYLLVSKIKKPVCVKLEKNPYLGKHKKPIKEPPMSYLSSASPLVPHLRALVAKPTSSHLELPIFYSLEMLVGFIPSKCHFLTVSPMLSNNLGMGMAHTSTLYALISSGLVMKTGIPLPKCLGLEFYQGQNQNILAHIDGLQDEHSLTQILDTSKNEANGQMLLEQIIYQSEEFGKIKLNSNDTVVKNLRQLKVDNSSLEGPSINSNDIKHSKRNEDGKSNSKKKKN
ncbi:hypothetical protein Ancab_029534, partial [Ancistrocladus abbreviatus]